MSIRDLLGHSAKFSANLATGRRHAKAWPIAFGEVLANPPGGRASIPDYWRRAPAYIRALAAARQCARNALLVATSPASLRTNLRKFGANADKDQPCRERDQLPARQQVAVRRLELRASAGRKLARDRAEWRRQDEPAQADRRAPAVALGPHRRRRRLGPSPRALSLCRAPERHQVRAHGERERALLGRFS